MVSEYTWPGVETRPWRSFLFFLSPAGRLLRVFCGCCEYFNDIYKIIYILIIWENPVHAITIYSCKWWFIEQGVTRSGITPEGLNIPAQGNALGNGLHIKKKPCNLHFAPRKINFCVFSRKHKNFIVSENYDNYLSYYLSLIPTLESQM